MPHLAPVTTPQPAAVTWSQHYATAAGYRYWPNEELVRWLSRVPLQVGARVLEVGCGNGANIRALTAYRVVGLDLCRAVLYDVTDEAAVVQGDITRLPFADSAFDAVVDCMTSQHVPWDAHQALYAEYRRVLAPGGRVFLYHLAAGTSTAGGARLSTHTYDRIGLFPSAGLVCLPTESALARAMARAGLTVTESHSLTRTYATGRRAHYAVIEGEHTV